MLAFDVWQWPDLHERLDRQHACLKLLRQITDIYQGADREGACALDDVLQLPYISGPRILANVRQRRRGVASDRCSHSPGDSCEERSRKALDIFGALPQRRDFELDDLEPVIQIAPEAASGNCRLWVMVRRGDHANIHWPRAGVTNASYFPFLEHAQQAHLKRKVADFVEQKSAVVGGLDEAGMIDDGAGEGATNVAEQFSFDERGPPAAISCVPASLNASRCR